MLNIFFFYSEELNIVQYAYIIISRYNSKRVGNLLYLKCATNRDWCFFFVN